MKTSHMRTGGMKTTRIETSGTKAGATTRKAKTTNGLIPANFDTDSMTFRTFRTHCAPTRTTLPGAVAAVLAVLLLLAIDSTGLAAQQGPGASLGQQSLRPYAHVFWAYGLAWALVLGWVVSISRRWSRVEDDLERQSGSE